MFTTKFAAELAVPQNLVVDVVIPSVFVFRSVIPELIWLPTNPLKLMFSGSAVLIGNDSCDTVKITSPATKALTTGFREPSSELFANPVSSCVTCPCEVV